MTEGAAKFDIAKLELKPGDILVLRVNATDWRDVTKERMDKIRAGAEPRLPEGVSLLIVGPAIELTKITAEQVAGIGDDVVKTKGKKK